MRLPHHVVPVPLVFPASYKKAWRANMRPDQAQCIPPPLPQSGIGDWIFPFSGSRKSDTAFTYARSRMALILLTGVMSRVMSRPTCETTIEETMKSTIKLSALLLLASTALASMHAYADDADTEALLRKNGCFKCHAVDKTKKGPAYKKVAAKYKGKADGEEHIIKQITTGPKVKLEDGTEEEHKIIETKDPATLKSVAQWILTR
jgi:cytochrome c